MSANLISVFKKYSDKGNSQLCSDVYEMLNKVYEGYKTFALVTRKAE